MNRFASGLVLAALSICWATSAGASELLVNGGFETGSLGPWFASSGSPFVTSAEAHSGTYSAAAFGSDEIRQNFTATATSEITDVSFWALNIPNGPFDQVTFDYQDGTSNSFVISSSSRTWTMFDVTSDLVVGETLTGFSIFGTSSGPTYFDDFSILTTSTTTPLPAALPLFATGLGAMGLFGWRRKRKAAASLAAA
jgi:hypothetical protein